MMFRHRMIHLRKGCLVLIASYILTLQISNCHSFVLQQRTSTAITVTSTSGVVVLEATQSAHTDLSSTTNPIDNDDNNDNNNDVVSFITSVKNLRPVPTTIDNNNLVNKQQHEGVAENDNDDDDDNVDLNDNSARTTLPIFYRSATLDNLSIKDAQYLLDGTAFSLSPPPPATTTTTTRGPTTTNAAEEEQEEDADDELKSKNSCRRRPLAVVIDLRNKDEIQKGERARSEGSKLFYSSLCDYPPFTYKNDDENNTSTTSSSSSTSAKWIHIPILQNINNFWDEAINRMDTKERIIATAQTAFKGGALDRAAARNLERGGLFLLYTIMLVSAKNEIREALRVCLDECTRRGCDDNNDGGGGPRPIIFHCQKGKDRTGILAMLLQTCFIEGQTHQNNVTTSNNDEEITTTLINDWIINSYAMTGDLLGGEDSNNNNNNNNKTEKSGSSSNNNSGSSSSSGSMVDWSHFRGSPPSAMEDTLKWIKQNYGSVEGYLDFINFGTQARKSLREHLR